MTMMKSHRTKEKELLCPQMCPGLPVHVLQEHQQLLERVSSQKGQLHRLHLELGAVHDRLTENRDLLVQLDA